ncbi:15380_t:CDS:2 [Cetraspora pellucida]|uniref:15380_t:CDS:1 n=1 Tax=Cetraspora pellucida TaxID=1433469 RepID=A0ACA9LNC4_9GLOM|nr:15380_t:CDS:2 [Cetraspora pellucida]
MHDALKISMFLRHDELGVHCNQNRSWREHKELWMIEEDYPIISPNHILGHTSIWLEDVLQSDYYDFHDRLTDTTFDRIHSACFHHITKEQFIELQALISQGATKLEIKDFTKHNGL